MKAYLLINYKGDLKRDCFITYQEMCNACLVITSKSDGRLFLRKDRWYFSANNVDYIQPISKEKAGYYALAYVMWFALNPLAMNAAHEEYVYHVRCVNLLKEMK